MAGTGGWSRHLPLLARAIAVGAVYTAALTWAIAGWWQSDVFAQVAWIAAIVLIGLLGAALMPVVVWSPWSVPAGFLGAVAAAVASRTALELVPPSVPDVEGAGQRVAAVAAGAVVYAAVAWTVLGSAGRRKRIVAGGVTLALLASAALARGPVTTAYRERAIARLGVPVVTATAPGLPFRGARLKWPRDERPGRGVPALRLEFAEPYKQVNGPDAYVRIYLWGGAAPPPATACRTVVELDEHEDHAAHTPCRKAAGGRWIRDETGDPGGAPGSHADVFGTYRGALVRVAGFHCPDDQLLATLNRVRPATPRFLADHWQSTGTGPPTSE